MDRDTLAALISDALLVASRRSPPDGFPPVPTNMRMLESEPGEEPKLDYDLEPGSMAEHMARSIGAGVAAGLVQHLRQDLKVVSSVAVDTLGIDYGSVDADLGSSIEVPLTFRPILVATVSGGTDALCVHFRGMSNGWLLQPIVLPIGSTALTLSLGDASFTIGTNPIINPGAPNVVRWLAVGDQRAINARGTATSVE